MGTSLSLSEYQFDSNMMRIMMSSPVPSTVPNTSWTCFLAAGPDWTWVSFGSLTHVQYMAHGLFAEGEADLMREVGNHESSSGRENVGPLTLTKLCYLETRNFLPFCQEARWVPRWSRLVPCLLVCCLSAWGQREQNPATAFTS